MFRNVIRGVRLLSALLIGLLISCASGPIDSAARSSDPPCDGWMLHTRTLLTICPEVVIEGLSGQGVTAIGEMAFDSFGVLLVTRPATGEVLSLLPDKQHAGKFLPPETFATGLNFPYGIACAGSQCYVSTQTQIIRLKDQSVVISDLTAYAVHPLHIVGDKQLVTANGSSVVSVNLDGSHEVTGSWPHPIVDFGYSAASDFWTADGTSRVESDPIGQIPTIDFSPNSGPSALTFYPNQVGLAFPQFANAMLVVTAGSWGATVVAGYELWLVPFSGGHPGTPRTLIPANTDRTNSDAALYLLTFFPDHPVAVSISPEGWIYVATREGRIVRLRPRV